MFMRLSRIWSVLCEEVKGADCNVIAETTPFQTGSTLMSRLQRAMILSFAHGSSHRVRHMPC